MTLKPASLLAALSLAPINPSPASLLAALSTWSTTGATSASNGSSGVIVSEDATNAAHAIFTSISLPTGRYSYTIWAKAINRGFLYSTVSPNGGTTRAVMVWGLSGQGFVEQQTIGASPINTSNAFKRAVQGYQRLTMFFEVTSTTTTFFVIGAVNQIPPTYNASFDATYQGLSQQSIEIAATELIRL